MMWYNNQPRPRRRRGGWYGFPWIIFLFIWIENSQLWFLFIFAAVITLLIYLSRTRGMPWNQQQPYYTPPIYQPPQQASKPADPDVYYQPYEQGYQAQSAPSAQQPQPYYVPSEPVTASMYEDYEEPRAEYPEQMPPMQ